MLSGGFLFFWCTGRVNRKENACGSMRPRLSRRKERSVYHTRSKLAYISHEKIVNLKKTMHNCDQIKF
ncbi:hypothetical protein E2C01_019766 [Portunus trituberculatus]|uniref:Uncharacterized protein n=1 Tax=Portunus trituberculatus TaxID=210409 RepID=A0A5B7DYC4_PORTR|nr:hypothetical protein [Portunus trituberculatus]